MSAQLCAIVFTAATLYGGNSLRRQDKSFAGAFSTAGEDTVGQDEGNPGRNFRPLGIVLLLF
jgi:hypothetical protein